jgi:hypothetical protein
VPDYVAGHTILILYNYRTPAWLSIIHAINVQKKREKKLRRIALIFDLICWEKAEGKISEGSEEDFDFEKKIRSCLMLSFHGIDFIFLISISIFYKRAF